MRCLGVAGLPGAATAQVDDAPDLEGVIDLHAHVVPETTLLNFRRSVNAIEAAQIARIYGMRGMVFKEHHVETASWAYLVSQAVPGLELFGGIVLNRAVGGINPVAVEAMALTRGGHGRVVYMPTVDSEYRNPGAPTVVPVSRNGQLLPEVHEVLRVMAKHNLSLSTGHLSPSASFKRVLTTGGDVSDNHREHPLVHINTGDPDPATRSLARAESVPTLALLRVTGSHGAHVFAQLARSGSPRCSGLDGSSARNDLAARAGAILPDAH